MIHTPPPMALRSAVGQSKNYFIHEGYQIQSEPKEFDDTPFTDEYQKEVYEYARRVLDKEKYASVWDIGCGSGFKLITNFFEVETVGYDLEPTVKFLRKRWPGRIWLTPEQELQGKPDLLICSDVIEHVSDPNELLTTIKRAGAKRVILSTPERDQLCLGTHDGPPRNIHHIREWNYSEFGAYIGSHLTIREHFVINGTQVVDCY